MTKHEYRVVWRRVKLDRNRKIFQTRRAAERFALVLQGRMQEVTQLDPDDYACCPGYECDCGGVTNAESWAQRTAEFPPLAEGPTVEARAVGAWSALGVERAEIGSGS